MTSPFLSPQREALIRPLRIYTPSSTEEAVHRDHLIMALATNPYLFNWKLGLPSHQDMVITASLLLFDKVSQRILFQESPVYGWYQLVQGEFLSETEDPRSHIQEMLERQGPALREALHEGIWDVSMMNLPLAGPGEPRRPSVLFDVCYFGVIDLGQDCHEIADCREHGLWFSPEYVLEVGFELSPDLPRRLHKVFEGWNFPTPSRKG